MAVVTPPRTADSEKRTLDERVAELEALIEEARRRARKRRRRNAGIALAIVTAVGAALYAGGDGIPVVGAGTPAPSPQLSPPAPARSGSLAYGVGGDIYVAEWDGSNPVRVADGRPASECVSGWPGEYWGEGPIWSPDGRYLAYRHTDCAGSQDTSRNVVISDPQGRVIAEFPAEGWDISWSPDSTRVAVWATVFETIGVFGVDGERKALLAMPGGWRPAGDHDPIWLQDGQSLLMQGVVVPIDGSTPYRLRSARGTPSPDGSRTAFATRTSLVVATADGSNRRTMFDGSAWGPVWSPTGDRIAFMTWTRGSGTQLRVLDVATGTVTLLAAAGGSDQLEAIDFSPEGDRIHFSRTESGTGAGSLWSVDADGSDVPRLRVAATSWGDWLSPGSTP